MPYDLSLRKLLPFKDNLTISKEMLAIGAVAIVKN